MKGIAQWGFRPTPLLPEILRDRWTGELPKWVISELNLLPGSSFGSLGSGVWKNFSEAGVSGRIRSFLISAIRNRLAEVSDLCLINEVWPKSLLPRDVPWSARTRNCLEKEGLLDDPARLVKLRVKDLLRIHAFGAASVLDLSCVAEAVLTAGRSRPPEPSNVVADILYLIEHDWAEQISSDDPRFADIIPVGSGNSMNGSIG